MPWRIWRSEGLKVPARQPKKGRLWLNDGSCVRLRPKHRDHVWAYDFVEDRTHDGRKIRMLNIVDKFTRECLAIRVAREIRAVDVIDVLSDLFILRGLPGHSPAECTGIKKVPIEGKPDKAHVSTSFVERQNLTMRMHMRRFTRLTNAFSKKFESHAHMVAFYAVWYNLVRQHKKPGRRWATMSLGIGG